MPTQTSLLLEELPANAWRKFACGSWTRVLPERTTQPEYRRIASQIYLPQEFIALPVTTINARITILKSVNTWTQCYSFVGQGSESLLTFMRRTPNRGASPCRETVKTITKSHLIRGSSIGEKGGYVPPIAIPRTAQILASFPAETSMLYEVVRRRG
jgi:hypothetical protein